MSNRNLLALLVAGAFAQPAWSQFGDGDNEDGFYIGAALGNFSSEIDDIDDANLDFDEDESASRLFAGWRFNHFFAAELNRYDFGEASNAPGLLNISADTKGWAPAIVGTLPLGPIELSARAGMLFYDLEINTDGEVFDESGEDLVYAAGIGATILEHLSLKLEYEIVEITEFDDAEAAWISASWRF